MRPFHHRSAAGLLLACLAVVGCETQYGPERSYGLRKDPVIKNGQKMAEERPLPDRPGQLPIASIKDLTEQEDKDHPFYRADPAKRKEFLQQDLVRDVNMIAASDRKILEETLEKLFGKPRDPKVAVTDKDCNVDEESAKYLQVEPATLARGSVLYREHCLHCHGVTGDGRGPTGKWVNPHPRDFRSGLFKFTTVNRVEKATLKASRGDLARTLRQGVEGTAMPSFGLLTEQQIQDLVSYVMHLSIRGETEIRTVLGAFDAAKMEMVDEDGLEEYVNKASRSVVKAWKDSQATANWIPIPAMAFDPNDVANKVKLQESVQRGKKLFEDKKTNCNGCHVNYGRQAPYKADDWGTLSRPRNLTQGIFRGGRRDSDLYARIHSGIVGSGMNNFGKDLKSDEIWDLVNFVRVLPYPEMRKNMEIEIPE
jgi:mono/diheme cytochrome c family protein